VNFIAGLEQKDHRKWDDFLARTPGANFRQTHGWGAIRRLAGWNPIYVRAEDRGEIKASLLILSRKVPYLGKTLFYGCRGPTLDWRDTTALHSLMQGIKEVAHRHKAVFLRMDPEPGPDDLIRKQMRDAGCTTLKWEYTNWNRTQYELRINLDKSEDEIFKSIRRILRQNINTCYKNGITVEHGIMPGDDSRFVELMNSLETVREAIRHSHDYYKTVLAEMAGSGGNLIKARYHDKIIGVMTLGFVGNRCWAIYMANDYEYRKLAPNKLLMWEGIKYAKQRGCTFFDMGATQSKAFDPNDPLDQYKLGFKPEVIRFPGYFDYPFSPLYRLFACSEFQLIPLVHRWTRKMQSRGPNKANACICPPSCLDDNNHR
jgi:peptidoglycan pentaglycine glycine transferase (the first glycine)